MFLVSTSCCVLAMKIKTQIFKDNAIAVTGWLSKFYLEPQAKKYWNKKKKKHSITKQNLNETDKKISK